MNYQNSILKKDNTIINLDQLNETKSMFSIFTTKNTITSICIYKSDLIFLFTDFTIIIYDPVSNKQKYEISDSKRLSPFQTTILYYNKSQVKKDYLLLLGESKLFVINFSNYKISYEQTIPNNAINMKIHFVNDLYLIGLKYKNKMLFYSIVQNSKSFSGFSFYLYYVIETDEAILTKDVLMKKNFICFETKNKICFYSFDTPPNKENLSFFFSKNENFSEVVSFNEVNSLNQGLVASGLKNKSIDAYKTMQFSYSSLINIIFISFLNKLYLVRSVFSPETEKFLINSTHTKLEIIDKIVKQNIIQNVTVVDPYLLMITDKKIYLYFVLDLQRCVENIEIDVGYDLDTMKQLSLLNNLNLINYEYDIIQYNDVYLVNEMKQNFLNQQHTKTDYVLNSGELVLLFFNSNKKKIEWIYLNEINYQIKKLKLINPNCVIKLLCSYRKNSNWEKCDLLYWNIQLVKNNQKFLLIKSLELVYSLINNGDYVNALQCINELKIELIFIVILLRKIIKSQKLLLLLEYFFKFFLGKFLVVYNDGDIYEEEDDVAFNERINEEIEKEFISQNKKFINLMNDIEIKSYKELPLFLKFFFNNIIEFRNLLKLKIPKEQRKQIKFNTYIEICEGILKKNNSNVFDMNKLISLSLIDGFTTFNDINEKFISLGVTEAQIKYCIIENIVFILNFYAYKISKQQKYSKNIQEMIKSSYSILDPYVIELLSEIKLESEILLYYYCRGDYQKCLSSISSIYDSINDQDTKDEEKNPYDIIDDSSNGNYDGEELNKSYSNDEYDDGDEENDNENEEVEKKAKKYSKSSKKQWLICYIKLICKIKDRITQMEFDEYLKWSLDKNSLLTTDKLIENGIISDEKIDEKFVEILKEKGIDPVIHYLQKFVNQENNETQSDEMVNLFTIKINLLQEASLKQPSLLVKYNYEIQKTRDELCNFLIINQNFNISNAFDKISKIPICQREIGIVLIKQNNYEEGIQKLFTDESPMKIILSLVEHIPDFELINMIIKKLLKTKLKFVDNDGGVEDAIVLILSKVQHKTKLLIQLLSTDLFDEVGCEKMAQFFIKILNIMEGRRETFKIESSFAESDFISALSKLYDIQSTYKIMEPNSICPFCKKGFINDNLRGVIGKDNKVYHENCFDQMKENNEEDFI